MRNAYLYGIPLLVLVTFTWNQNASTGVYYALLTLIALAAGVCAEKLTEIEARSGE
ncbi:hypothetical protein MM326_13795 [Alkalihalobacillus sp. LMS6]|jgi:hypothetical protein|uniref:hypothetical protein n=1 Tax=Alkalihalobacillus sp. LMS6 TaxID=2924034 RepID=UPI0020D000F8|nr:hypothetical protein [Alkalihalobacillus sp. LMS6]UTR05178.1 hypothetical protein MM326_13795 [Alkalihalobacillus sp. LMS6]